MYRLKKFCDENHSIVEDPLIFMLKTRAEAFKGNIKQNLWKAKGETYYELH